MPFGEIFGYIAGALTTASFIPQVIRVFKLRSAREISLLFTTLLLAGLLSWLAFGIAYRITPVILWNAVGAVLAGMLLYGKLRYGK